MRLICKHPLPPAPPARGGETDRSNEAGEIILKGLNHLFRRESFPFPLDGGSRMGVFFSLIVRNEACM